MPSDAAFCPSCGAGTNTASYSTSSTEFDRLTRDRSLQEHWFGRVIAFIIDAVIFWIGFFIIALIILFSVGIPAAILGGATGTTAISTLPFNTLNFFLPLGWITNVLFWFYFAISESWYGETFGKRVMRLRIVTLEGNHPDFGKTLIRNVSKIYWPLLLLDIIGGLFTKTQPGQKFSDHYAGTIVVKQNL